MSQEQVHSAISVASAFRDVSSSANERASRVRPMERRDRSHLAILVCHRLRPNFHEVAEFHDSTSA